MLSENTILNRCRIYLQAWTLSDLVDGDVIHLTQFAYNGRRDTSRTSSMQWPDFRRPDYRVWDLWKRFLSTSFCYSITSTLLRTPLTSWITQPLQQWQWYYHPATSTLSRATPQLIHHYTPSRTHRQQNQQWYTLRGITPASTFQPHALHLATIGMNQPQGYMRVSPTGWIPQATTPPPPPNNSPQTLRDVLIQYGFCHWMLHDGNDSLFPATLSYSFMEHGFCVVSDTAYKNGIGAAAIIIETPDQVHQII